VGGSIVLWKVLFQAPQKVSWGCCK